MLTFKTQAAQGDMLLRKIDRLPDNVSEVKADNGKYVLAHSETGHHHTVKATQDVKFFANDNDPFVAYLVVDNTKAYVEHERSFDTHAPIEIKEGVYEIRRQREYTLEGFRRVQD